MWCSFLTPSRGRPESLRRSIASLLDNAYDPMCFEVLVYVDLDDPHFHAYHDQLSDLGISKQITLIAGEPLGYARLHECIAYGLVPHARGQWLWLWNDDAEMTTPKWDVRLRRHPINSVLNPDTNHQSHATGLNVFPVVPKAWVDLVGWSRDGATDTWWQFIGNHLNAHRNLDVYVVHDRSDLTGGHDDATRAGNNYNPDTFWCDETQAEIRADALRIAEVFG
jgi:hypothetical protein